MASYYLPNGPQDQGTPTTPQLSHNGTSPTPRHGGGHIPAGPPIGNASTPPSLSSSQPTYTQPSFQVATQYGSQHTSPQPSTGRHGGGHVPHGALTTQPTQQNPNYIPQQPYVPQTRQTYAPYGQVPGGGPSQGYDSQGPSGYTRPYVPQNQPTYASHGQVRGGGSSEGHVLPEASGYTQPQAASSSYPPAPNNQRQGSQVREVAKAVFKIGLQADGLIDSVSDSNNPRNRTVQQGYGNLLNPRTTYKWPKFPNAYQKPGWAFLDKLMHRHRDSMQRQYRGVEEDRYLSPFDGHLAKLVVQATQDVYDGLPNSTWRRTFIRNASPFYIRIANFPFTNVPTDVNIWTSEDWTYICLKWIPACVGLLGALFMNPNDANGQVRNNGYYDPFPYRHWLYPDIARNVKENLHATTSSASEKEMPPAIMDRALGPRDLCFVQADGSVVLRKVQDHERETQYVFIGYTAEQFNHDSEADMYALDAIAVRAAQEAGVAAYWVGSSCLSSDEAELVNDVYRISDVMRSAHSLAIAVGPSATRPTMTRRDEMLRMWGERMWTLPEALLSSNERDIKVFGRGDAGPAWVLSKKHFAATVWDDPLVSRQLVDHYDGSLLLSRLELVTIALKCLSTRKTHEKFPGDMSYALMGLMRRRPVINPVDSKFKAFARLSLANDSDMLLERLMCMQPKHHMADWTVMEDAWDANLWDISPHCQVAGVGPGDTVILDGAFGAAIRWKSFAPVAYLAMGSWGRLFSRLVLHSSPTIFIVGISFLSSGFGFIFTTVGVLFVAFSLIIILMSPFLVRKIYTGKLWGMQAWFFGFEGYMDLATIESHIFGAYMGRLKWSPAGSPISAHMQNQLGECVGIDPITNPNVRAMVEQARKGQFGGLKVFTLVDTLTLTVTMFTAVRPPVAVLLCGHEGGMQRAVMASYDWKEQTLYREAVLRMETPVLSKMDRVHRFRFGFKRPMVGAQELR